MPNAILADRAFLAIDGDDAADFLQGLVTADLDALEPGEARLAALLTPQGKILFEFLVARSASGFVLETGQDQIEALTKRLTMYRLRAKVTLTRTDATSTEVSWGDDLSPGLRDMRFAPSGLNVHRAASTRAPAHQDLWEDLRISHGIAEAGRDFPLQDAFPHDALYDLNTGVSFKKGCYVGQEVVSRMQHRSTARRRIVILKGQAQLPPAGTPVTAGGKDIGNMGTSLGHHGLAILRIDKIGQALAQSVPILAGDVAVACVLPAWSGLSFPSTSDEVEA